MGKGITGRLFKGDRAIWYIFFILSIVSIIEVFSASSRDTYDTNYWASITKHTIFVIAGVFMVWFMHNMKLEWIKGMSKFMYICGIILLLYGVLGGGASINQSGRWVNIAGIQFQHFEVVKLGVVMLLSLILAKAQGENGTRLSWSSAWGMFYLRPKNENRPGDYTLLTSLIIVIIPCAFIITENLSTVVIILLVVFLMMLIGRVNWKHMLLVFSTGIAAMILGVGLLLNLPEDIKHQGTLGSKLITWKHRLQDISESKAPERPEDVKISGEEQRVYSKIAIAEGGVFGRGPGNSVRRDYIPHANNDFIYAIILEELGLIGGIATIILYLTLLYRCGMIAKECDDPYACFLILGIGILITVQALIHMSISVGDFITGQPLPLISQGGTSFLINCMYIGIILSVSRYAGRIARKGQTEEIIENTETNTNNT